jgi:hypothetical protein
MVIAREYDEFGREVRQYLPFASSAFGSNYATSINNLKKLSDLDPGDEELHAILRAHMYIGKVSRLSKSCYAAN